MIFSGSGSKNVKIPGKMLSPSNPGSFFPGYEGARSKLKGVRKLKGSIPHESSTKNNVTFKICTGIHVLDPQSAFDEQTRLIQSFKHFHRYDSSRVILYGKCVVKIPSI